MDSIILSVGVNAKNIERDIIAGARAAEKALHFSPKIDPTGLNKLSGPLGRLNSQASEFNKSLEASNARVIAFGASAGAIFAVQKGFAELLKSAIEVEKVFADINSVLGVSSKTLEGYKRQVFDIAKNTGATFQTASEAFLELSRQGLSAEASAKRLNAALVLARLGGLDAKDAVEGLTAAINSFNKEALDDVEVVNKLANVAAKFAVSEKDLTEAIKRSASAASDAGVNFDELAALVTSAQQTTARGGAVIGNALKTIFTRLQRSDTLDQLEELGVATKTASGAMLGAQDILKNLADVYKDLGQQQQAFVSELVGGVFQINQLKAQLSDLGKEYGVYEKALVTSTSATNEALMRNEELNKTVSASINSIGVSFTKLADQLGSDIFFPVFRKLEGSADSMVKILEKKGEEGGISFGEGIAKGIGGILSGPGLIIGGTIVVTLFAKLAAFAVEAGKSIIQTINGVERQRQIQNEIQNILAQSGKSYQDIIRGASSLEEVEKRILAVIRQQVALKESSASITSGLGIGSTRLGGGKLGGAGLRFKGGEIITAASGILPIGKEREAISRGVGGARAGAKPVVIPNFSFGKGKRGTVVANTDEYIVPNYANGGSAVFNRDMVNRMGLPSGAMKISGGMSMAGGFVPNYANNFLIRRNKAQPLGSGIAGEGFALKGKNLVTKRFGNQYELETEFNVQKLLGKEGVGALQFLSPIGNLDRSKERGYFAKEKMGSVGVLGEMSRSDAGLMSNYINRVINVVSDDRVRAVKSIHSLPISPDSHSGNYGFNKRAEEIILGKILRYNPNKRSMTDRPMEQIQRISDSLYNYIEKGQNHNKFLTKLGKSGAKIGSFDPFYTMSSGYIPNFANPLQSAISREISAGVNPRDIYIDKDSRVKSSSNPMGLLVANKRDEPMGGFQGVNRAARMGVDPKKHGMSGGYVPNFAEFDKFQRPATGRAQFRKNAFGDDIEQFDFIDPSDAKKLRSIFSELRMGGGRLRVNFDALVEEIKPYIKALGLSEDSLHSLNNKIGKVASNLPLNIALSKINKPLDTPESRAQWIEEDIKRAKREKKQNKGLVKSRKERDEQDDYYNHIFGPSFAGKNKFNYNSMGAFPGSTYAERGTGRDLFNLSYAGISEASGINVSTQRGKVDAARAFRGQLNSYRTTNLSKDGALNKTGGEFVETIGRLAKQDTLQETFKNSVKKSIADGMDFNTAVKQASNDFVAAGGSSKQLRDAVVKNAKSFTDLEKNLQIEKTKRQETITDIAKRNDAEMALAKSNGELAALTKEQQVVIRARMREEVKATLGLAGVTDEELKSNPMALRQVQALESNPMGTRIDQLRKISSQENVMSMVQRSIEKGQDLSPKLKRRFNEQIEQSVLASNEFQGFSKDQIKTNPYAKKLFEKRVKQGQEAYVHQITSAQFDTALNTGFSGRSTIFGKKAGDLAAVQKAFGNRKLTPEQMVAFENRQQQVQQNRSNRLTGVGIGASFLASGLASSGMFGDGKLAGGMQGAATGASMGAFFGPVGLGVGIVGGGIWGALSAAGEEAGKVFQKTAEDYKKLTEELNNNGQSLQNYTSAQEQLNTMIKSGTAKESDINNLNKQMSELFNSITDNDLRSNILAAAGDMDKLAKAFEDYSEASGRKEAVERVGVLTASATANRGGFFSGKKFKSDDLDNVGKALAVSANLSESKIKELNGALSDLAKSGDTSVLSAALKEFGFDFEKFGASFSEGLQVLSVAIGEGNLTRGLDKARGSTVEYTKAVAALNAEIKKSSDKLSKAQGLERKIKNSQAEIAFSKIESQFELGGMGGTEASLFKNRSKLELGRLGMQQGQEKADFIASKKSELIDFIQSNVSDPQQLMGLKTSLGNASTDQEINKILEESVSFDEKSFKDGKQSLKTLKELKESFNNNLIELNITQLDQIQKLEEQNRLTSELIRRRDLASSFGGSAKFGQAVDTSVIRAGFAAGATTTFNNKTFEKSKRYDLSQVGGKQLRDRDEYNGRYSPDAAKAQITEAQGIIDAGRMFPELIEAVRTPEAMVRVQQGAEAQLTQNNKDVLLGSLKGFFESEQGKNGIFNLPNGDVSSDGERLKRNIAAALRESRGGTDFTKLKEVVQNSGLEGRSPQAYERLMRMVDTADQFSSKIPEAAAEQAKELLKTDKERKDDVVQSYIDGLNRSDMTSSLKEIESYMAKMLELSLGGKEVVMAQLGVEGVTKEVGKAKEAERLAREAATDLKKKIKLEKTNFFELKSSEKANSIFEKFGVGTSNSPKGDAVQQIENRRAVLTEVGKGGTVQEISSRLMNSEEGKRFASQLSPTDPTARLEKLNQLIAEFAGSDEATKLNQLTEQYNKQSAAVEALNVKLRESQKNLIETEQIYGRVVNINSPTLGKATALPDVSREVVAAMFGAQKEVNMAESAISSKAYTIEEAPKVRKNAEEKAAKLVTTAIDKEGSLAAARAFSETFLEAIKNASPEVSAKVEQKVATEFNLVLQDGRITKEEIENLQRGLAELAKKVFELNNENKGNKGANTNPPPSNPNSSGAPR